MKIDLKSPKLKLLERLYSYLLVILFFLIVLTPYFIRSSIGLLPEEMVEGLIIALLFGVSYFILKLYQKEVAKNLAELERLKKDKNKLEDELEEAFRYIGAVNVQIQAIKSVFAGLDKYPESKKDFKRILYFLADRILAMVNVDWVVLKIVNTQNSETLREHSVTRGPAVLLKYNISNKDLIEGNIGEEYIVIASKQKNFFVKAFCIIPKTKINKEQKIFIQAIVNQLEMLFIIFTSVYYKNSNSK